MDYVLETMLFHYCFSTLSTCKLCLTAKFAKVIHLMSFFVALLTSWMGIALLLELHDVLLISLKGALYKF